MGRFQELLYKHCNTKIKKMFLSDICRYVRGVWYNRSCIVENSTNDAVGVLSTKNLFSNDDTIDFLNVKYVSNQVKIRDEQFLKKNDILICKEGSLHHIGKVAYVFDDSTFTIGGTLGLIRANEDMVCPRYLYYVLSSDLFWKYLSESICSGSTICRLNSESINTFEVPLPPLDIQEKIAYDLDNIQTYIIKENKQNIEKISNLSNTETLKSFIDEDYYFDIGCKAVDDNENMGAYSGKEEYIFVSYAHKNKNCVLDVIERLQKDRYRIWYDEGIDPGTEWDEYIAEKIEKCGYFIAFVSKEYMDSENCKDELKYARDLDKGRLLVYLEDIKLTGGMAMRLNRLQAIHKYTYPTFENFIEKIESTTILSEFKS